MGVFFDSIFGAILHIVENGGRRWMEYGRTHKQKKYKEEAGKIPAREHGENTEKITKSSSPYAGCNIACNVSCADRCTGGPSYGIDEQRVSEHYRSTPVPGR